MQFIQCRSFVLYASLPKLSQSITAVRFEYVCYFWHCSIEIKLFSFVVESPIVVDLYAWQVCIEYLAWYSFGILHDGVGCFAVCDILYRAFIWLMSVRNVGIGSVLSHALAVVVIIICVIDVSSASIYIYSYCCTDHYALGVLVQLSALSIYWRCSDYTRHRLCCVVLLSSHLIIV